MSTVTAQDSTNYNLFKAGTFYIGVNTNIADVAWTDIRLSPQIGLALSDREIIYGFVTYTNSPKYQDYKIGYDRQISNNFYLGFGLRFVNEEIGGEHIWSKWGSGEIGLFKSITKNLYLSPKLEVGYQFGDSDKFDIRTNLALVLKL